MYRSMRRTYPITNNMPACLFSVLPSYPPLGSIASRAEPAGPIGGDNRSTYTVVTNRSHQSRTRATKTEIDREM